MNGKDKIGCVFVIILYMFFGMVAGFGTTTIVWAIIFLVSCLLDGFRGK